MREVVDRGYPPEFRDDVRTPLVRLEEAGLEAPARIQICVLTVANGDADTVGSVVDRVS